MKIRAALVASLATMLGACAASPVVQPVVAPLQNIRVVIEFKPLADIRAQQAKSTQRETYDADALTFFTVDGTAAVIWLREDRINVPLLGHELCHLQRDPDDTTKLKGHDALGYWKHTGRRDIC